MLYVGAAPRGRLDAVESTHSSPIMKRMFGGAAAVATLATAASASSRSTIGPDGIDGENGAPCCIGGGAGTRRGILGRG